MYKNKPVRINISSRTQTHNRHPILPCLQRTIKADRHTNHAELPP
jgi:hypothetical protein